MAASSGVVARSRSPVALWLLGAALATVPPVYTAPSLAGTELDPLAFVFGLALAGLMAGAAVVAFFFTGGRAVAVPVAAGLAGVGAVAGVTLFADSRGAGAGWVAAVGVTGSLVRRLAQG